MKKLISSNNGIYVFSENNKFHVVFSAGDHANTPMIIEVEASMAIKLGGSWEECSAVFSGLDTSKAEIFSGMAQLDELIGT